MSQTASPGQEGPLGQQAPPGVDLRQSYTGHMIASISVCMVISGVVVIGRFASRKIQRSALIASDYLCVGAFLGAWAISLIVIEEATLGLGRHVEVVPTMNLRKIMLLTYIGEILYPLAFTAVKLSILLLFRTLFPARDMLWATNIVGAIVIMWGIALLLVSTFACNPIHSFWDNPNNTSCINFHWYFLGNAIPNIVADVAILCLPIHKVWQLQMSMKTRLAVSGMFMLGGLVVAASVLRMHFVFKASGMDVTWSNKDSGLWSAVEIDVAVISACLPTIRPALRSLYSASVAKWVSRTRRLSKTDETSKNFNVRSSSGKTETEEFQRLPEYTMESQSMGSGHAGYNVV